MEDAAAAVMRARFFIAAFFVAALGTLGASSPAWARSPLDPFAASGERARALDPFRPTLARTDAQTATVPAPAPATPAPATPAAAPARTCATDEDCPDHAYCDDGTCRTIERRINIAYLFFHEGNFTELLGLYWNKRGRTGYRVVFPVYFHFWSPTSKSKVYAPFYWRFEDYARRSVLTVAGPVSWSSGPEGGHRAFWPLFYQHSDGSYGVWPLFTFRMNDRPRQSAFGAVTPLYWWSRTKDSAWDVGIPLFFSKRSKASAFTYALPLNFYWRTGQDSHLLAIPFVYNESSPKRGLTATLLGYRSTAGANQRGSLFWLYWYGRSPESKFDVLFPLLWSFRGAERSTTVAGPFIHLRRPEYTFTTFLPLFWAGRDKTKGSSFHTLLPFYFWRSGEGNKTATLITPIGGYRRNDETGTRTWLGLVPPLFVQRDAQRSTDVVLGLYWRFFDRARQATTTFLPVPPIYHAADPQGSSTVVFPLFWHFRDAATRATAWAVLPFFARRNGPEDTTTFAGVFPLGAYFRKFKDGGRAGGLVPLAFFGHRPGHAHGVIFPVLWHFRDGGTSTTVSPLFYRRATPEGADSGVPPVLTFWGERGGESYAVQFPFFWRFANAKEGWSTTVAPPPFFYAKNRQGWQAGLVPLAFFGASKTGSHQVVTPLFWRFRDDAADKTTVAVPPLLSFYRRHGGERTYAFLPLLYARFGARPGGTDESAFTLFPLVHYRRDAQSKLLLTPLAGSYRAPQRKAGFVLPYFWYENERLSASGVPPLYFDVTRTDTGERTRMFGPFFAIDRGDHHARFLFPFFGRYEQPGEHGQYAFPTFFSRRTESGYALDTFFPLYWHSRWPGHDRRVVGPWFRRADPTAYDQGVVPFAWFSSNEKRKQVVIPPLLTYHREDFTSQTSVTSSMLLFHRSTRPDGHSTTLFPLAWFGRKGERNHQVIFPVFWRFEDKKADKSWWLALNVYRAREGTRRAWGFLPYYHSGDDRTGEQTNALYPLFFEKHAPGALTLLTPIAGFRTAASDTKRWGYVGPFIWNTSLESSFHALAPIFFRHQNKTNETTTWVVPPLLHVSRTRPDSTFSSTLLLFWHQRDIGSETRVGLPLYFDHAKFHETRTTLFFPFFLRHRRYYDDTTTLLLPVPLPTYARWSPTSSAIVGFPLYWRFTEPGRATTVGFPLYWSFLRGDAFTRVVFPVYWNFQRPTYESWLVLNTYVRKGRGAEAGAYRVLFFPLAEWGSKRPGDFMWEAMLGAFGYERIGRNRFMKLLFIPIELSPAPRAATAWYGAPPPSLAASRPRRGVSTASW